MSAVSQPQLDANLANAQLSTGPRTEEGKQHSSQNAVRHAIFAKAIPAADQAVYQRLLEKFQKDLAPKGAIEDQLVHVIADTQWRIGRCSELEQALLFADTETPDRQLDALNRYSLYEQRLTRIFQMNMKQLREIQADRRRREEQEFMQAAAISRASAQKQIEYDPVEDGFVFSAADLAVWIRREDRFAAAKTELNPRLIQRLPRQYS